MDEKKARREMLAAFAMAGLMANSSEQNTSAFWPQAYAKVAVQAADALIAELDKPVQEVAK